MQDLLWTTVGRLLTRDRSPARRRLSRRAKLVRFLGLALLVCAGFIIYQVPRVEALRIQRVEVSGASHVTAQEIIERSGLMGRSFLGLPGRGVPERLEQIPYVAHAQVETGLSTVARVEIQERVPRLLVKTRSGMYLVDDTGVILERVSRPTRLPMLETNDRRRLAPGTRLDPEQVAFVLTLFAQLPVDVRPAVEKLTYDRALGYELVSTAGWRAILGDADQIGVKSQVLRQVLARRNVGLVDVSAPATPYYRLRSSPKQRRSAQ